jgi:hypothetical protein
MNASFCYSVMERAIKPSSEIASPQLHGRPQHCCAVEFALTRAMRHPTFCSFRIAVPISHTYFAEVTLIVSSREAFLSNLLLLFLSRTLSVRNFELCAWLMHVASFKGRCFRVDSSVRHHSTVRGPTVSIVHALLRDSFSPENAPSVYHPRRDVSILDNHTHMLVSPVHVLELEVSSVMACMSSKRDVEIFLHACMSILVQSCSICGPGGVPLYRSEAVMTGGLQTSGLRALIPMLRMW